MRLPVDHITQDERELLEMPLQTLIATAKKMGDVSAIFSAFQKHCRILNPSLNAFLSLADETTAADLTAQNPGTTKIDTPLAGIPIAHKDLFCTTDFKTTCGSKMLENFISPFDADIVQSTKIAGGVCIGKTNMDEFAMGSATQNPYFGSTKNPWNLNHVAGGSSGGSAAAVAARLVPLASASDTGGSIRQPAAFCGVTGFKPTYGSISRWGMVAYASSLDQAGPIAKTAYECALYFDHVNKQDDKDSTCVVGERAKTLPVLDSVDNAFFQDKTIGYLPDWLNHEGLDAGILKRFEQTKQLLESKGATFKALTLPSLEYALAAYYILAPAEASSNLSRFDGVRFGHQCDQPVDLEDLYKRSRQEGFGSEVKRRILTGTFVLSEGYFDAYYQQAQRIRRWIKNDFDAAFSEVDLILTPTTPTTAFEQNAKVQNPVEIYLQDIFTIPANLAGLPGISFPVEPLNGLPVGMQFMGQTFADAMVLAATHAFQIQTTWHQASPLHQEH